MTSTTRKINIKPGAIVEFTKTALKGDVTIGKGTVIHPGAQIIAEGGPIIIGDNNLIEDDVVIQNIKHGDGVEKVMIIGNGNVFEVRSRSEARMIGDNNLIQMTAHIQSDVTIGNGCVVGVGMKVKGRELSNHMQLYIQDGMVHERQSKSAPQNQTQQLEYLRNAIPNYHKIYKPTKVE